MSDWRRNLIESPEEIARIVEGDAAHRRPRHENRGPARPARLLRSRVHGPRGLRRRARARLLSRGDGDPRPPVYRSVSAVPGPVDMVNVFRRPHDIPPHVPDILAARPRFVWFQLGIVNDEAAETLARAGHRGRPGRLSPRRAPTLRRRAAIRAHLLRWRPRPGAQRTDSTPRARPSGAASHMAPSRRPAPAWPSSTACPRGPRETAGCFVEIAFGRKA